ncbi:hypothetical protein CVT26_016003 [Gymnopilus dilepis]|uniref:Uncharacterized protein n=1 Tax=Gymnopilus dilepis TaxID=231916 RepID=A0A409YDM7_9AGAR|nr:hypothetical protein CVT26_016003 [Gymnopilus dilepis]
MHASFSAKHTEARKKALEEEIEKLQAKLGEGIDAEKVVQRHITLLHKYNEAKDATQVSFFNSTRPRI